MRNVGCIEDAFQIPAGAPTEDINSNKKDKTSYMPKLNLIITLMAIVALIIIGLAIYVFTHLSGINPVQSLVLIGIAVVGFLLVIIILILFVRSTNTKK